MATPERELTPLPVRDLTPAGALGPEQVALIKRTVAKGCTDDELALFLHACRRTGLDPFMRQIYAVKRWSKADQREVMSIQTGIDGLRLVAERTKKYAPGREPSFSENTTGGLIAATAYIKKQTEDGTWHEVCATAYWTEYVQVGKDGKPTRFWAQMPHVMLAKVAETLALRRAFPMEMSGVYTVEEMAQADAAPAVEAEVVEPEAPEPTIGAEAAAALADEILQAGRSIDKACKAFRVQSLAELTAAQATRIHGQLAKGKTDDAGAA